MRRKKAILQRPRIFSEEFRKACVDDYEKGIQTVAEMAWKYGMSMQAIYKWIRKYSVLNNRGAVVVDMRESSKMKERQYKKRIAELERALGQKQLKVDFLEKMIELADEAYDIDIKKNGSTPLSHGSGKTKSK